jgi:ABC-type antimicrobial peptide transport system permease subunit
VPAYFETIKQQLLRQNGVTGVTTGSEEIVDIGNSSGGADWIGRDTSYKPQVNRLSVDADYQKVMGLKLKSGRWFRPGKQDYSNFIINETAEAGFNMHKPVIGQQLFYRGDTGVVIGVVKDFYYRSLHEKIGPMILYNNRGSDAYFFVKLANGNIPGALARVADVWKTFAPKKPFSYNFLDDSFNNLYKSDVKTSQLLFIFSLVAIIICAMGLFGLATFTAERRTKEIGIRKILGASVTQVTMLLTKEFLVLVAIAVIIASPLAWWAMNKWLQGFAYRISLGYWVFIIAGLLALFIAVLSVCTQAVKTAMSNPANSLRTE